MSIAFVIPSIRPITVNRVLHDLDNQTLRPTRVLLVDNSTRFDSSVDCYRYHLEVVRPKENLGTNPVWNLALRFEEDYCGILGDDYRLEPTMVEKLLFGLHLKYHNSIEAGMTVPEIVQQKRRKPPENTYCDLGNVRGINLGTGKGKCSAVLMKREIAHSIPFIPDHFKIFFGDNWIGYHICKMGLGVIQLVPCYIYHTPGASNVSASLNYAGTLKKERIHWNEFMRNET